MTAIDRLRVRLGSGGPTPPRAYFELPVIRELLQLHQLVKARREAVCSDGGCGGEGHVYDCPVELARQDVIAASLKLEGLE